MPAKKEQAQPNPRATMPNFYQNLFQGVVQPMGRPKQRNVPAFEQRLVIETNQGRNFNVLKVYIHKPTLQYPEQAIFLQLSNAKGSCFIRLESLSQVQEIADFLSALIPAAQAISDQLSQQESVVNNQLESYQAAMQALQASQEIEPEE